METTLEQQKENTENQVGQSLQAERELFEIISDPKAADDISKEDLVTLVRETYAFSGPLPPPQVLYQYEKNLPGTADRIISMAEKEQNFRHSINEKMVNTESRDSKMGILSAGFISFLLIIGGIVVILNVPTIAGTIVGGLIDVGGIATIVGTYLSGTSNSWKNKKE